MEIDFDQIVADVQSEIEQAIRSAAEGAFETAMEDAVILTDQAEIAVWEHLEGTPICNVPDVRLAARLEHTVGLGWLAEHLPALEEWASAGMLPGQVTHEQRALLDLFDSKPGLLSAVTTLLRIVTTD